MRRHAPAVLVVAIVAALLASTPVALAHPAHAIISNGTVQLGVWDEGHLNVPGGVPSSGSGTTDVGVRYLPTGAEATAPGCLCEGWGAADDVSKVTGYANEAIDHVVNLAVQSFTTTATTAVSVVDVGATLEVTHDYHPSSNPNLYEVVVTIKNISSADVSPLYRRVMDWDIEPTFFDEFVTIDPGNATALVRDNNDGFTTANPLGDIGGSHVSPFVTGKFTDVGPTDHGAHFDFSFPTLAPGASRQFKTFYGAAATQNDAEVALGDVGAEVYSFGQPHTPDGPTLGTPNTFIFAFSGVGGDPAFCTGGPDISVTMDRPVAGHTYSDDVDTGPNGGPDVVVQGSPLTVTATSSNPGDTARVDFRVDGVVVGSDTTAPYSLAIPTAIAAGSHVFSVHAVQKSRPSCVARDERPVVIRCFDVLPSIVRPASGRVYVGDVDVGPSGGDPLVVSGILTTAIASSDTAHTGHVETSMDTGPPAIDATAPYQAVFDFDAVARGAHVLNAKLVETNPFCSKTVSVSVRKPDPAVKADALGLQSTVNVPTEQVVRAGGVAIGGKGGTQSQRILDQALPPAVDSAHVLTDSADGAVDADMHASASSEVSDVSLLGGVITADVLHAKVSASETFGNALGHATDAGSSVVNLRINGNPVDVPAPNTVIPIPGVGSVVVQETIVTPDGARAEITVNMLHVFVDSGIFAGEIFAGSAHAGVNLAANVFTGPDGDILHRPDDLDTKTDAGGDAATAMPITPGVYSASFTPGDDVDVYSFDAGQGDRIQAAVKPAERRHLLVRPAPQQPVVTSEAPDADLYLYDPDGNLRSTSATSTIAGQLSPPERVELNADTPFQPAGAKGRWTLVVKRAAGSPDGFYMISLDLLPETLMDQNDAGQPGDARDLCVQARPLGASATHAQEIDNFSFTGVIKDADRSDFYSVDANAGQLVSVALKPDELADGANFDLYLYGPDSRGAPVNCTSPIQSSRLGGDGTKASPDAVAVAPVQYSGTYVFEVRRVNGVGNYYANVNVTNPLPALPDNDAQTGADAGNDCSAATTIQPGLYEGRLPDLPVDDVHDWYAFSVAAGQDITALMSPSTLSDFDLELYGPGCAPVAPDQLTVAHQPLSIPETAHLRDAAAGTYALHVSRTSGGGNYLLDLTLSP